MSMNFRALAADGCRRDLCGKRPPLQTCSEILNNPLHQNGNKSEEHAVIWRCDRGRRSSVPEAGPSFKQFKNRHQASEIDCKMRLNRDLKNKFFLLICFENRLLLACLS